MKPKLLNVKQHLKHCEMIFDALKKYGYCPAIEQDVRIASLIGRSILAKHEEKKTRKDIYIGV